MGIVGVGIGGDQAGLVAVYAGLIEDSPVRGLLLLFEIFRESRTWQLDKLAASRL